MRRILLLTLPITAVALALTACSTTAGELPRSSATATAAPSAAASPAPTATCNPKGAERSFAPLNPMPAPGTVPSDPFMQKIKSRGRLIAGVSADTWKLGARNPLNGQIEGFDIDMVRAVAQAIFNERNPQDLDKRIEFRVITAAQRIPSLQNGAVDIVARAMTVNCGRWQQINFSTVYYVAGQKVLVASDPTDPTKVTGMDDLSGKKVCAPKGTTTLDQMKREYPKVVPVVVDLHTDCLALFQEGRVEAITGDDTILAGFAAQDPYAKVVGARFSSEPYGLGIAQKNVKFTQFVNGVLAQIRSDGAWQASYDHWLRPALGPSTPPAAQYGRPLP